MRSRLSVVIGIGFGSLLLGLGVVLANAASVGVTSQRLSIDNRSVSVPLSTPTVSLAASSGGTAGLTSVTIAATLSSGTSNATGTLTFKLWTDANCTKQFGTTSSAAVAGANGVSYESGALLPMVAGTYRWTVDYSGDSDNLAVVGQCGSSGSTVTITVGPATKLVFTQQPNGGPSTVAWTTPPSVTLQDAGGNTVTSGSASVSLAIGSNPGSGTLTCTSTTKAPVAGTANFDGCSIDRAGVGYTLIASASGLVSATSSAFTITDSSLTYVAVGTPATATSNSTVAITYPSGTVINDLLVLVEVSSDPGGTPTPAGWTLQADQSQNSQPKFAIKVWTRLSAGETSVSLSFKAGSAGSTAWVMRYSRSSGYPPNPTTATASVQSGVNAASATFIPSPALTTNAANARVISIVAVRAANTLSLQTPQSFGFRFSHTSTPTGGQGVAFAVSDSLQVVTPSTPGSPTWAQSGTAAQWAWATIAWQ